VLAMPCFSVAFGRLVAHSAKGPIAATSQLDGKSEGKGARPNSSSAYTTSAQLGVILFSSFCSFYSQRSLSSPCGTAERRACLVQ
jgi:hypothetical protein